jgi:hypothetical protein
MPTGTATWLVGAMDPEDEDVLWCIAELARTNGMRETDR